MITTVSKAGSYQLKYRIECAKSNDKSLIQVISEIPELRTFMLPSGSKIYFSGDYFLTYPEAKTRLEQVQGLGFKDAFIRVFKYQKMLSHPLGKHYIKKVVALEKRKEVQRKNSETRKKMIVASKIKEAPRKTYTKREIETRKKKREIKKTVIATIEVVDKKELIKKEEVKEEVIVKNKEEVDVLTNVDEAPVYKILLAKTKPNEGAPDLLQLLADEVVYSYREGKVKYFAVGFYKTSTHADRRKDAYRKYATQEPEVIGFYKGRVISLKLAKDLHKEFKKNSQKL